MTLCLIIDQLDQISTYLLWQPLVTMTNNNTNNKSLSRISSGDHKRTQQGVSARLLSYLYKLHMVHATNNYSCPNVHASSMSTLYVHYEIAIQLICSLISSIQSAPVCSRPMTLHHVTSHVTLVTCLFIANKNKKKFKRKEI